MLTRVKWAGFTLVELLVVVAIIALLLTVVLVSGGDSHVNARDKARVADIEGIRNALEQYAIKNGEFPCEVHTNCASSAQTANASGVVGEGGHIDTLLSPYMPEVPHDPLGPGDSTYQYIYDGSHACGGQPAQAVVFAVALENASSSLDNYNELTGVFCSTISTDFRQGLENSYNVILGPSSG